MDISNFVFSYLKEKLPTINWNIGSAVRELIAQPIVTATERANQALNTQINAISVQAFVNDSVNYEEEINNTFSELGLSDNNVTISTGTVTILTHNAKPDPVYKNTAMYYNDQVVIVADDTYPSLVNTEKSGFTQLRQIGYNSYMFEVKVQASTNNTYLANNTPLIWDEAPSDVYDIFVSSAVSGGRLEMTLEEKAKCIQDYVAPRTLTLNDGIAKHLRSALPDTLVDAKYASDIFDNRRSYLYVKTVKAPGNYFKQITGYKDSYGLYNLQFKEVGIISVIAAFKDHEQVNIHQLQIVNNDVYCTLEYDGELTESFSIQIYGLEDSHKIQEFIDGYTVGSPFDIEVKAPSTFSLNIDFSYTGQELSDQQLKEICNKVQFTGLNVLFNDTHLQSILKPYGAILKDTSVYTLTSPDGSSYKQKYSPAVYSTKANSYAVYTSIDKVNARYV